MTTVSHAKNYPKCVNIVSTAEVL